MDSPAVPRLDDIRRAAELLPAGSMLTLSRESLLAAIDQSPTTQDAPSEPDRTLTAAEVATLLRVRLRWVYLHYDKLGGRHLSPRCVRFSERAVKRFMERKERAA